MFYRAVSGLRHLFPTIFREGRILPECTTTPSSADLHKAVLSKALAVFPLLRPANEAL